MYYFKNVFFSKIDYINLCGFHDTYNKEGREKMENATVQNENNLTTCKTTYF